MKNILLFLSTLVLGIALMGGLFFTKSLNNKPQLANKPISFSIKTPPSESVNGKITSFSQELSLQERGATDASKLESPESIKQGERIVTDNKGNAVIEFDKILTLKVSSNTDLDIIQTLPQNFVFAQNEGTVLYEKLGNIPVSIRALHLLIDQGSGNVKVNIDKENGKVTVDILKGTVTLAFNNLELKSILLTVSEGKKIIFDDSKRKTEINDF
jgi:hypothetical protein